MKHRSECFGREVLADEKAVACNAGKGEEGVAALEFALVLPVLLMLVLGIISVGHAMVVRYVLNNATYDAARTCTMAKDLTPTCAAQIVNDRVTQSGGANWCNGMPTVNLVPAPDPNYPAVTSVAVTANCAYRGIIATGYLQSHGFAIFNIRARAVMPY